jgi:peptidyl-prolyl cis-trans isomerase D
MLRGIRKASANWLGRAVMGVVMTLLAGSFAVWGINDIFRGFGRSTVAKIGDTEIPVDRFQQTYNDRLQQLARQIGRPIPPEQANTLGIDRQVLGEMVTEAGLDQRARQLRLGVSNTEIARRITADPAFQSVTGQFDRARFEQIIRGAGFTEQRYVADQRGLLLRRQIVDTISGGLAVPKAWLEALNQYQNQRRAIAYLSLGPAQAGDIPQPTAEQLSKYFADRKTLFRAPEFRKIVTVTVTPTELAKSSEISDDDVKHAYEQNRSQYITPERHHVEQIVFPNMADAQAAAERIKSGTSFEALAAERKLKPADIDLGMVPKSGIIDPAVADAAFSLKPGEVSAPVAGSFGAVLVTVTDIAPEQTKPLDVVAPFIRADLGLERAKTAVADVHDKIEDARAGGATLQEAAAKLNLPLITYDALDRSGRDPSGQLVTIPHAGGFVTAAFATDVDVDNEPIEADGGYVWYEVTAVTPPRDRTLDEVKSQVEDGWRNDEIAARLKTKAADMLDKLKGGTSIEALATAEKMKLETASGLQRGNATTTLSLKEVDTVFRTAKAGFASAEGEKPTEWIVFQVIYIDTPSLDSNPAEAKNLDQTVQRQLGDDLFTQYVTWLDDYLGTSVNQAAVARAVGNGNPDTD